MIFAFAPFKYLVFGTIRRLKLFQFEENAKEQNNKIIKIYEARAA